MPDQSSELQHLEVGFYASTARLKSMLRVEESTPTPGQQAKWIRVEDWKGRGRKSN